MYFFLPSENIRNPKGFLMFPEGEKGCTGNKWVNSFEVQYLTLLVFSVLFNPLTPGVH